MRKSPYILLALCVGVPLTGGVAFAQKPAGEIPPSGVTEAVKTLPPPDQQFVRQASGALMAQIRFGQLAQERAQSPSVRQVGRQIADQGTALSDQMRRNASDVGVTLPIAQLTPLQMQAYSRLSQLSGPAFDQAYMAEVQALQQQTMASFQNESLNGETPELKQYAQQSLPQLRQNAGVIQQRFDQIKRQPMPQPIQPGMPQP